ncbi:MAG: Ribosomal RNA small subunit methyltransferase A [candidate division WWE3 bacterium GW2011_GWA1_41_8]|uniref:Ribosomal RNA small subunit methyltransferase A n=1 Tax=candidate division WWE3 bacterium GW2011_GWA1_41_8 TaxID=1619103 RepID=A0A0G0ZGI3_UNCKA|nr:MAG: Ribosomal RNA small subunit methyltransferase A [candidate division WWE3 bacterium GW2011_GWA1_41_8]
MYTPHKELGQNFLTDREVARTMVAGLELSPGDEVVEIGAGLGAVTEELAEQAVSDETVVHAVEIDIRFVETLKTMFLQNMNINIVEANILDWLPTFIPKNDFKVIGSLPYYITSPIIHKILEMERLPRICVLMIQKEVAEKIAAQVPDASYMSSVVQTFYDVEYVAKVPKGKFVPSPKVDGGIIKMVRKTGQAVVHEEIKKYEGFLHRGYASPRKKVNKVLDKDELARTGIDGNLRPQNLSADHWVRAYRILRAD